MMQANPSLSQTSEPNRFSNDLSSRMDNLRLDQVSESSTFTYVPPDPRSTYIELLNRCLDWDLEVLKTLPEDEDVSLGILSPEHVNLLGECATRWRLPASFRSWVFLEAIVQRAEQGLVPTACIHEATGMVGKVSADMDVSSWANSDVSSSKLGSIKGANRLARRPRTSNASTRRMYPIGSSQCFDVRTRLPFRRIPRSSRRLVITRFSRYSTSRPDPNGSTDNRWHKSSSV